MSDYPYPADEFDLYDQRPVPVGVHRAPASMWSRLWPFLLVMALCATVALVGVRILTRPHHGNQAEPTTAVTEPAEPVVTEPLPGEGEGEDGEHEPDSLEALLEIANMDAVIRVLNDSGPTGEAGRGTAALQALGFNTVQSGNYPGDSGLSASSVWYQGEAHRETALAVAKAFGIPEDRVTEHDLPQGNINVIIISALTLP